jgi:hypothetical protein
VTSSSLRGSGWVAKNAAGQASDSYFCSQFREHTTHISHTRNNWICYNFNSRRILPTHYAIRSARGGQDLKSWLIEASTDGQDWKEIDRREDSTQLNGAMFTRVFAVAARAECRFIRLVNIGANCRRNDAITICAWEIFGQLIE